jgi:hypothetical protein
MDRAVFLSFSLEERLMTRLTMALVALLICVSAVPANVAAPRRPGIGQKRFLARQLLRDIFPREQDDELVITETTEVKLDGRTCKYADIPGGAEIVLLQIAADKKAILKIHFRSKKASPSRQ